MYQHFLSIQELSKAEITQILAAAQEHLEQTKQLATFTGKWVVNAFFEPSTRTRCSFEIAAKRLGAEVLNLDIINSSAQKGEEILDTFKNLAAMGCDVFVIRHTENHMAEHIAKHLNAAVINAGNGQHEHPTQAILDMLTIRQHKTNFAELSVAIVGDIIHSRVARSDIFALQTLGVEDIRIIAPRMLLPSNNSELGVQVFDNLSLGLKNVDVIIALRIQKERMRAATLADIDPFYQPYQITTDVLSIAKPDVLIMHPGPLNRETEITSEVADGPHSAILQQAKNGVAARMAVLEFVQGYIPVELQDAN